MKKNEKVNMTKVQKVLNRIKSHGESGIKWIKPQRQKKRRSIPYYVIKVSGPAISYHPILPFIIATLGFYSLRS